MCLTGRVWRCARSRHTAPTCRNPCERIFFSLEVTRWLHSEVVWKSPLKFWLITPNNITDAALEHLAKDTAGSELVKASIKARRETASVPAGNRIRGAIEATRERMRGKKTAP
jgi:hypothetical protein